MGGKNSKLKYGWIGGGVVQIPVGGPEGGPEELEAWLLGGGFGLTTDASSRSERIFIILSMIRIFELAGYPKAWKAGEEAKSAGRQRKTLEVADSFLTFS